MKKRNLKFALLLQDGKPVRSLDELKMYYDIDKILAYFQNGQLERWLEQNEYIREYELIQTLKNDMKKYMEKSINGILLDSKAPQTLLHSSEIKIQSEVINAIVEDEKTVKDVENIIENKEIKDSFECSNTHDNIIEEKSQEMFSINGSLETKEAPCLFRKPLKIDDNEIYGKGMLEHRERFPFKNRIARIEKESNKVTSAPKMVDDDFFNDEFFMDDTTEENDIIREKSKEKNELGSYDSIDNEITKTDNKDQSVIKKSIVKNTSQEGFQISSEAKKKLEFGLGNFGKNNSTSIQESHEKGIGLGLNSKYSEIDIEDNRKQLLEMKKKSVFSKLKAENSISTMEIDNNIELSKEEASSTKENIKDKLNVLELNSDIDNTVKEINEVKSNISENISKSNNMNIEDNVKNEFAKDNEGLEKKETAYIEPSTEIDIQSIMDEINSNVEKNAKLIEESNIISSKSLHENLSEKDHKEEKNENSEVNDGIPNSNNNYIDNTGTNKILKEEGMTIEINPKLNTENSLLHNNDDKLKKYMDFEKINEIENKQKSNVISETVKSYKATVYSQQEYEDVLKRRASINTRLRIIVSFSGLKISDENANIEYIGINKPTIILIGHEVFDCVENTISFSGIRISAENTMMVMYDKVDNCTFDKTKIKKGINDLMEKYPSIMMEMKKTTCVLNEHAEDLEHEITVEKYIDTLYEGSQGNIQIMTTVQLTGLRIFTDLSMGVINMAFYKDHLGKIHDISDIFNNMESIDIFKRDVAIGIEFMALITDDVVKEIEKEKNKKYENTVQVLEEIFSYDDMLHYLEYVMIAPVRIFEQNKKVSRIDQVKIIDIMNIDTGIPYIYEVFSGSCQSVKKNIIEFIESAEKMTSQNGIDFNGVSIECVNDDEIEIDDLICYEFIK